MILNDQVVLVTGAGRLSQQFRRQYRVVYGRRLVPDQ